MDRLITYTLIPYAFIGLVFISLLTAGLIINGKQCAIALDRTGSFLHRPRAADGASSVGVRSSVPGAGPAV